MANIGVTELIVIFLILLLLFGTKRLRSLGSDLGSAIKGFRTAMSGDEEESKQTSTKKAETADEAEKKDSGQAG